ncbi:unnamed protein product [Rotaria sp. Silwood2]|nr:unnamed protein product [Rotaria sp. Silwood2]
MLRSPRTNGADNFVPSRHLALITQPVLGARSRSRKKTTNIIVETSTSTKEKLDSMTSSRRSSYNDSPPLILPINRIDTSQYQKKTNLNSHHESSDSGLDLSLSTNSSVQFQQYSQQHIPIHRPLSALNEDSSPDDGYHDEHQQESIDIIRLRCPPINFGRNRSMEDMISNNTREEQQHRSSSFSDERQQKLFLQKDKKMKRSSDGALLDILDTSPESTESYRRTNTTKNELLYTPNIQQHRSLNDLNNKTSSKVIRHESNIPTIINNLSTTHTIIRKPNTSTLKPLRKKTKLNILIEPSIPLTSSRLTGYDEQINAMTGTTSSSSNQTTPRSIRPLGLQQQQQQQQQQQHKSKAITQLAHYSNQEQMRAHVNRSVIERQHPVNLVKPVRPGVIQQRIPFDASPSKVNNLLLRYHGQQPQPSTTYHSNIQGSTPFKYAHKRENSQDQIEQIHNQRHFIGSIQRQQDKELSFEKTHQRNKFLKNRLPDENENIDEKQYTENILTSTPRRQYEHHVDTRQRQSNFNDSNRNSVADKYESVQSTNTTPKLQDANIIYRRQHRNVGYADDPIHINQSNEVDREIDGKQQTHGLKTTGIAIRNKNNNNEKKFNRTTEANSQYGPDHLHGAQKKPISTLQSRPSKVHFQTFENPINHNSPNETQIDQNLQSNQWRNSKYENDHHPWEKSQNESILKTIRIQPIHPKHTNIYNSKREREISQLSNISKGESIQSDEKKFNPKIIEKNSTNNLQSKSSTSWPIISEHDNNQQQFDIYEKITTYQSQLSTSPLSHDELVENNSNTPPPRTYRLMNDKQQKLLDGRYFIPSNNLQTSSVVGSSSHPSSCHTYPFTLTNDFENNNDIIIDHNSQLIKNKKNHSHVPDVYVLSDRESTQNTIDRQSSSSPLENISSNKKIYSPQEKIIQSTEQNEITSNYDSDDGWSDDSAELLYVDERYATEKRKITSSSHLPSQQPYHYQVQQQNVLLKQKGLEIAQNQRTQDLQIAEDQQKANILAAYESFLVDHLNRYGMTLNESISARFVARFKTLTAINQLDQNRKTFLIRLLFEAKLIVNDYNSSDPISSGIISLEEADLSKISLSHRVLQYLSLPKVNLTQSLFTYTILSCVNFYSTIIIECDFTHASILKTKNHCFPKSKQYIRTIFVEAIMNKVNLFQSEFIATDFTKSILVYANMRYFVCLECLFLDTNMFRADLSFSQILMDCNFQLTNLTKVLLLSTLFIQATFIDTIFTRIQTTEVQFERCSFTSIKFINCTLDKSLIVQSNFSNIYFNSVNLSKSIIRNVNFMNISMHYTNLSSTIFDQCTFINVDFNDAILTNATFLKCIFQPSLISNKQRLEVTSFNGSIFS